MSAGTQTRAERERRGARHTACSMRCSRTYGTSSYYMYSTALQLYYSRTAVVVRARTAAGYSSCVHTAQHAASQQPWPPPQPAADRSIWLCGAGTVQLYEYGIFAAGPVSIDGLYSRTAGILPVLLGRVNPGMATDTHHAHRLWAAGWGARPSGARPGVAVCQARFFCRINVAA
jgi:hypothetical protein